jgi:serine/threonine-protein kinase HipA
MISFPVSGVTGDVIVKLDPPEYRNLCANEAAVLTAARVAGLRVPPHQMVRSGASQTGLVVARFDRQRDSDGVRRFPVEDGCQVLGRYPADKYNLDTVDVLRVLASRCTAPPIAAIQLFERFLFAYLAGDGDFHARNVAVWQNPAGLWEPSPIFDAVCTAMYGDTTLAGPLDGDESVREIGRRRMVAAAVATGLSEKAAVMTLDRRVPMMAHSIREALSGPVFSAFPHLPKVERMLARRADLLVE